MDEEKQKYRKLIYAMLDDMKMETMEKLLKTDKDYQRFKQQADALDIQYCNMELPTASRIVIDQLLDSRDCANYHFYINAYLAGLIDAVQVFAEFGVDD